MASIMLKPPVRVHGSAQSSFGGLCQALRRLTISAPAPVVARAPLRIEASGRKCQLTGKKANNGYVVTFSHKRNKKLQQVNLQWKRVFWPEKNRWIRLRLSTKIWGQALKTIEKKGLQAMAKEVGLDLESLPYVDASSKRTEWLAQQPKYPPMSKTKVGKATRMKNPEKIAASKKKPLVARYVLGGPRVILTRDPAYVEEYR